MINSICRFIEKETYEIEKLKKKFVKTSWWSCILGHESVQTTESCGGVTSEAYVISVLKSNDVRVSGCDLYGCGFVGIYTEYTQGLDVNKCVIRDCQTNAVVSPLRGENLDRKKYLFDKTDGHLVEGEESNFWVNVDGRDYWYEGWQRQGWNPGDESYRGKEIYDAWYWLDNVNQGAKAVSKDVYQESYSAYPDREDGTGKWMHYDEAGHMIKGWQKTEAGTWYFEEITGAMAKGRVSVGGTEYHFDEVTGILK